MKEPKFQYGPVSKGIFIALAWGTFLVLAIFPDWLFEYLALLVFLVFGLRPVLVYSGIFSTYSNFRHRTSEKLDKRWVEKKCKEVEAAERSKRLKHQREKNPNLPKNW
jgi:hypothetical protein